MIPWELCRSFLAVARHGSLSAAARALQLTQPTLGRHVDQLERALGTAMFTRSPQGLLPTETALSLVPLAEVMESAAEAMLRAASGHAGEVSGVVRITASDVVGAEVLPPILAGLADQHPNIAFELHLSNQTEDLLRRDADIAVRMVRPIQTGLVARLLGDTVIGLFAHRRYLADKVMPRGMEDLTDLRLIGFDRDPAPARAFEQAGISMTRDAISLRTDSDLGQLAAIRAGYGVGGCQVGIARRDPDLVRLLPEAIAVKLPVWLVMHGDLHANVRIRHVFDRLATGLRSYLAGQGPEGDGGSMRRDARKAFGTEDED